MIEILKLQKQYGQQVILDLPSYQFLPGIHWLKGGNGSGKTTLMRVISGLATFSGSIKIKGIDQATSPVAYRNLVSYAEAEPLFPSFLRGTELINLYQQARKGSEQQSGKLLADFGIGGFANQPVGTFSSGMLKKLSLALAFIGQQQWILLDEPLVTLEDHALPTLSSVIQDHHRNGISFLITSHQPLDGLGLAVTSVHRIKDSQLIPA
ncbi:MAG: ATP-binding cassette domain-containing protein [Cyclobacteriaceae bacterium]|nr:ATP-binding cassette domain-containing protein [Cyclobacteriaceae bacterium]